MKIVKINYGSIADFITVIVRFNITVNIDGQVISGPPSFMNFNCRTFDFINTNESFGIIFNTNV